MISTDVAGIYQSLQHFDQLMHIRSVQSDRGFIQHVQRPAGGALRKLAAPV